MDKPNIEFKSPTDNLTRDLPAHLKNPANYRDIQVKIIRSMESKCNHTDLFEFSQCAKCTDLMLKRRKLLKSLGFKNARQYMQWQKIHEEIRRQHPLVDWKNGKRSLT